MTSTGTRPTPLKHYLCPRAADGLHLVQDEHGKFNPEQWHSAVGNLPVRKEKKEGEEAAIAEVQPQQSDANERAHRRAAEVLRVVGRFQSLGMLPAIVFAFSRKECELLASLMSRAAKANNAAGPEAAAVGGGGGGGGGGGASADVAPAAGLLRLLTTDERSQVTLIYEQAVSSLAEEDATLPQVTALLLAFHSLP